MLRGLSARRIAAAVVAAASALVAAAACNSAYGTAETPDDAAADAARNGDEGMAAPGDAADSASDAHDEDPSLHSDGCSDGTREGYALAPRIAACAGSWKLPGLIAPVPATCLRQAGNSGSNATGGGCSAGDLCAVGWHVCVDHLDVTASHAAEDGPGPCELAFSETGELFYATAQPSNGGAICGGSADAGRDATNDVFGCGDLRARPDAPSCGPLNALLSSDFPVKGWFVTGDQNERETVEHIDTSGGVLCCAD